MVKTENTTIKKDIATENKRQEVMSEE